MKVQDALGDQPVDPQVRSALLAIATSFDEMRLAVNTQLLANQQALSKTQRTLNAILVGVVVTMFGAVFSSIYA